MKRVTVLTIITFAVTLVVNAQSISLEKRLAQCALINGELERLDCYDKIAKDFGLTPSTQSKTSEASGKWHIRVTTNPIDDSKTIILLLPADEGGSRLGGNASLIIRCESGQIEVYIDWNEYLGSKAYVVSRVGSNEAKREVWEISGDSKATFYPNKTAPFIKLLMTADRFVAQVTPYSESPVTAIFDTRGLSEAIKSLQETCKL